MKPTTSFVRLARWCGFAAGAFLAFGLLRAAEPAAKANAPVAAKVVLDATAPLHVFVDLPGAIRPGSFGPWSEEDFSRVLGGYVKTEFKKAGYTGEVTVYRRWAELPKEGQRLEARVNRWGADRLRGAECTLTAELTAADGRTASSGVVSETQLEWSHNIHGTAGALEDVARHGMRTLYGRFAVPAAKNQFSRRRNFRSRSGANFYAGVVLPNRHAGDDTSSPRGGILNVPIRASSMKTILSLFLSTALLVGVICFSSGRPPGVLILFASAFAAALFVWTLRQYERRFDPLPLGKPVRLPVGGMAKSRAEPPRRLAA